VPAGQKAAVGDVLGYMEEGQESGEVVRAAELKPAAPRAREKTSAEKPPETSKRKQSEPKQAEPKQAEPKQAEPKQGDASKNEKTTRAPHVMPAARRALADAGLEADQVGASGPGGRMLVEDVERRARELTKPPRETSPSGGHGAREEEVVPMSPLRRRIAERLVAAQNNAAILTTFNEIDMQAVQELRSQYQQRFQETHGIKLGLMSFFVKAAIDALRKVPAVNAEIRGSDIAYRNYFDIGVAIGGGKGLVVPVLRNAERMSFADIERTIADFARRAAENQLTLEELQGGTFTISNGGVYGSLLSTPILNPPQSGILGLHAIQERAVVRQGQIAARPMMYVALSYDHRLIDGRESVTFLKHIVECIEAPARILLEL
jgi:2-oxoglutarate dehydrogenase E2 component (dihydrolipoamide succinyltransferase)